jgi:hypothetical protein
MYGHMVDATLPLHPKTCRVFIAVPKQIVLVSRVPEICPCRTELALEAQYNVGHNNTLKRTCVWRNCILDCNTKRYLGVKLFFSYYYYYFLTTLKFSLKVTHLRVNIWNETE